MHLNITNKLAIWTHKDQEQLPDVIIKEIIVVFLLVSSTFDRLIFSFYYR